MDGTKIWLVGVFAAVVAAVVTPLAATLWRLTGRQDSELSLRKIHENETPRVGGMVILLATVAAMTWMLTNGGVASADPSYRPLVGTIAGAAVCGVVGILDDLFGMPARHKLALQSLGAAIAIALGLQWQPVDFLFDRNWASMAVTAVFLVACANAINLLDGLDGLAGGVAIIGLATVILAALAHGHASWPVVALATALLGATAGFLLYNRHPARVFLGDGGAYFLGFSLAALLMFVEPVRPRTLVVRISVPLMVMALPLLDVSLTVIRRLVRGQPVLLGDADHIHHRLLARGVSHGQATLILWLAAAVFGAMGLLGVLGVDGTWTLAGTLLTAGILVRSLGYQRLFTAGKGPWSLHDRTWLQRRRDFVELLDALEHLGQSLDDRGMHRWRRIAPELELVLRQMGINAFQIRAANETLISGGAATQPRAWLDLPLQGGAELRLGLSGGLAAMLQPEQQVALERLVAVVGGSPLGTRVRTAAAP